MKRFFALLSFWTIAFISFAQPAATFVPDASEQQIVRMIK